MRKVEVAAPKGTGENTPELKKKGGRRAEKKTVTSEQCQQRTESETCEGHQGGKYSLRVLPQLFNLLHK